MLDEDEEDEDELDEELDPVEEPLEVPPFDEEVSPELPTPRSATERSRSPGSAHTSLSPRGHRCSPGKVQAAATNVTTLSATNPLLIMDPKFVRYMMLFP